MENDMDPERMPQEIFGFSEAETTQREYEQFCANVIVEMAGQFGRSVPINETTNDHLRLMFYRQLGPDEAAPLLAQAYGWIPTDAETE